MRRIYWDSMLFVYFLEGHPQFGPRVRQIHQEMTQRGDALCTSIFTVGEMLTGPEKTKAFVRVKETKEYFESKEVELIPFRMSTAEAYAKIRAANSVLPADAVHLASAAEAQADLFLTNDKKLQRLNVPGIKFIAGLDGKLI
jgi:predicted nucleic acid-binding protein